MAKKIDVAEFNLKNLDALLNSTSELKTVIDSLSDAQKQLKKDGDTSSKTFVQNQADIKSLRKEYNAHIKVLSEANKKIADQTNREKLLAAALNQEVKSIDDARASNKLLNKLRNSANATTKEGVEEIEKLNKALDRNNEFIKENSDAYAQQKIGIGGYKDAISEALAELNPFNSAAEKGEGSFTKLSNGIKGAARSMLAFVATPIGAFITALAGIGLIAKQLLDYNKVAREAAITTEAITNAQGDLADEIRFRSGSITEVFGNDFQENIKAAKALVQGFGITYGEAFDVIEDGLIRGGSKNNEFIDSIREYPKFFATAGFSAQEFVNIINEGSDLGIFNDKLQDSLKEFNVAISEQTDSAKDALNNAFGAEFTTELFNNINTGAITVKDALSEISQESKTAAIGIQQQAQLTADLFKGAGEDAGGALLIFEAVNNALSEEEVILTELEQQIYDQVQAQNELARAKDEALKSDSLIALQSEFALFGLWIETKFYQAIGGIGDLFYQVSDIGIGIAAALQSAFSQILDFNSIESGGDFLERIKGSYDATLQILRDGREAKVEIARQEADDLVNEQRLQEERLEAQRLAAQARIDQKKADANQREIEKQREQQEKLREDALDAREKYEQEQLDADRDFESRKKELQNEIDLFNAETDLEKELLKAEQQFEKDQLELERIQLTESQKTELLALLEENRGEVVQGIRDKYNAAAAKSQNKADSQEINQRRQTATAVAQVQNILSGVLRGILGDTLGAKLAAIGIEAAIEAGTVGVKTASSNAINLLNATTVAPPPANLGFIAAATAQNALSSANSAKSIAAILSSAAIKGFGTAIGSSAKSLPKFEQGGSITGNRHGNGGVNINAEGGEFMFSRKAVSLWGLDTLGAMNREAKGNTGINYSGHFADGGQIPRDISSAQDFNSSDIQQLISDSINDIKVVNVASETEAVLIDNAIITENAGA